LIVKIQGSSHIVYIALLLPFLTAGCAGFNPANERLEAYDPHHGYQPSDPSQHRPVGDTVIYLAFSGGGTRAAAFAYGVMQELKATEIPIDGQPASVMDEVDTISGVSGGSFPAAYYGLFGDRIFEDFESVFLKRNIQGRLMLSMLNPWNLFRVLTPWLSRSDLASRLYDRTIFDHATFKQLTEAKGPKIFINATDLSSGERVTFSQESVDPICTDLDKFPIATAVAASSAVPMLLSPITLENYAGTCGYTPPDWIANALANPDLNPRRKRSADRFLDFTNPEKKKYIHLVDGGVSDNLGLRAAIDFVEAAGGIEEARKVRGIESFPKRLVVIVVNAETDPNPAIDLASAAPSFAQLMNSVSGGQIRRYNFETLLLVQSLLDTWSRDLSNRDHPVEYYFVNVSFDNFKDEARRRYFKRLPTSFVLTHRQVDDLEKAGRELLRESREYQKLVEALNR